MARYFISTVLFVGVVFFLPLHAHALTISPVKVDISGDPGQTLHGEIALYNELDIVQTLYSSAENFEDREEKGVPFFLPDRKGLAIWIKTETQVGLEPQERKTIPFSIEIPQDAEPGGYFAAILWSSTPPNYQTNDQVSIGGRLGMLILLRVSGEVQESGELVEFGPKETRAFFDSLPVTFVYRFKNTGNVSINPGGEIIIEDWFGSVAATMSVNPNANSVLPGNIRKFEVDFGTADVRDEKIAEGKWMRFVSALKRQWNDFAFGRYTAELNLTYGANDTPVNASAVIFVFPWQLLSVITLIVMAGLFLIWKVIKKYNQWIIRSAIGKTKKMPRGK